MDAADQSWQLAWWLGIQRGTPCEPPPTRRTPPLVCLADPQPRCGQVNTFLAVADQRDTLRFASVSPWMYRCVVRWCLPLPASAALVSRQGPRSETRFRHGRVPVRW
jgi:hypothetical protein